MSLTTQDLQAIEKLIKTTVKPIVEVAVDDRARISEDLVRQEIKASETRMEAKMDARMDAVEHRMDQKMESMENRILDGVHDTLEDMVRPKLDDHEKRITKLETKAALR